MLRVPLIVLAIAAAALMVPSAAAGAVSNWANALEMCGGAVVNGDQVASERGSGQMDAQGRLYLPCSRNDAGGHENYVAILGPNGQRVGKVPLVFRPGYTDRASDVAPSPDGSHIYAIRYDEYTVYRFDRQLDGRYVVHPTWRLSTFTPATPWSECGGAPCKPRGQFLATDANGDIYLSTGLWTCQEGSPHCTEAAIVKYDPAGNVVARFGQQVWGSFQLGHSHGQFGGVAVTASGSRVFVTDINNNRVQRFDQVSRTEYRAVEDMGRAEEPTAARAQANNCYEDSVRGLSAPYDVALTPGGEVVTINTSCYGGSAWQGVPYATLELHRYTQAGAYIGVIRTGSRGDHRVHGVAVDRTGAIHLVQGREVLYPAAGYSDAGSDAGGGGPMGGNAAPDTTPPTITALGATPTSTTGTAVTLTIAATDAVGVTELRIREDGVQGAWRAYATSVGHAITARYGAHDLQVEVRDASGNVSAARGVVVTRVVPAPEPPVVQPRPEEPKPRPTTPEAPKPAVPDGDVVVGGGGDGRDDATPAPRPDITRVSMPVQLFRGRALTVRVAARGEARVTHVRFSTNGRWSAWQRRSARHRVLLPRGAGWKGVLIQVRDTAGTRSVPWFQPLLHAPRGSRWWKGTRRADRVRLRGGGQHVDLSSFDRRVDRISCGAGFDTVLAQPEDRVARDCERVTRVRMPAW